MKPSAYSHRLSAPSFRLRSSIAGLEHSSQLMAGSLLARDANPSLQLLKNSDR